MATYRGEHASGTGIDYIERFRKLLTRAIEEAPGEVVDAIETAWLESEPFFYREENEPETVRQYPGGLHDWQFGHAWAVADELGYGWLDGGKNPAGDSVEGEAPQQTATCLEKYASKAEQAAARSLIHHLLQAGAEVSLCDGEDWTIKSSRDRGEILAAMATTGKDVIVAWKPGLAWKTGGALGSFCLMYQDGSERAEVIFNHSDNDFCHRIARLAAGEQN